MGQSVNAVVHNRHWRASWVRMTRSPRALCVRKRSGRECFRSAIGRAGQFASGRRTDELSRRNPPERSARPSNGTDKLSLRVRARRRRGFSSYACGVIACVHELKPVQAAGRASFSLARFSARTFEARMHRAALKENEAAACEINESALHALDDLTSAAEIAIPKH